MAIDTTGSGGAGHGLPPDTEAWMATIDFDANRAAPGPETPGEEHARFLRLLVEYNKAWSPGPTSRFHIAVPGRFYQRTDRLFAFDLFPPADGFAGWAAYAEELTRIIRSNRDFTATPRPETFRFARRADAVWMASSFVAAGAGADGALFRMDARQTVVLEPVDGRWLVAHEHISVPSAPA